MLNLYDVGALIQTLRSQLPQVSFSWPAAIYALLTVESSMGVNTTPNFAASFGPGGNYFDEVQEKLYTTYGEIASSAIGPFQIIYRVAWDHGFRGTPESLALWPNQVEYFGKIIQNRFTRLNGESLEDLARTWNGGNPKGSTEPGYIKKFNDAYSQGVEKIKAAGMDLGGVVSKMGIGWETVAIAALIVIAAKLIKDQIDAP